MADRQVAFNITDAHVEACEKYISPERLAGYYALAHGNRKRGIVLYEFNTELSEALYGVIQGFEVTLRNAIHNSITEHTGHADWYDRVQLGTSEATAIAEAKRNIEESREAVTSSRIVGQVNLGFWVRLFSSTYDKTIYSQYIRRLFPKNLKRTFLHGRMKDLKTLRNRIAHHQRIIGGKRDLQKDYTELIETISWISPEMALWVSATNCFLERVNKGVRKLPKAVAAAAPIPAGT